MKKTLAIVSIGLLAVLALACGKESGKAAGPATAESLLRLMPKDTTAVVMVDVQRAMKTERAQEVFKKQEANEKYGQFVEKFGIDPMKDVYSIALGLTGQATDKDREGVLIVNLKYDKEALLAKLKDEDPNLQEETYNGVTLYKPGEKGLEGKEMAGAFLTASDIIAGTVPAVRQAIDVYQKKAESVLKNAEMAKLMKSVNTSAITWIAAAIPPDLTKMAAEKNPQLKILEGITGLTMSFDYQAGDLVADIQTVGGTKDQNTQIQTMLNGLKAMGLTFAANEPVLTDLLNTLDITSGDAFVKIYARVPGELLTKLQALAQERFGGMIPGFPGAQKEEPKGEKKEEKK